ncbi:chain-length determining protein [Lampropedia cohaerens]|uniref:Chain-length determining protein n=2 Tax=Lampropedia cohaerens TaxID=1610491 RepID=A0A0U1PZQ4_9BURK|nr:chain-length determining protein [Lampropedia cohaerens]
MRGHPLLIASLVIILIGAIYWGLMASDRYVSETHLIVENTDLQTGQSFDLASALTGGGYSTTDLRLLRDHLRSVDMLQKLQDDLDLKAHYSGTAYDWLSRLPHDASQEEFHDYYLRRVSIEIDDQVGVLRIRAQAYDAPMAQAITRALLTEGEAFMNEIGHTIARTQVEFLERQVEESNHRAQQTRNALLEYQNATGLISPQAQAESLAAISARLEGELASLQAQRSVMLGYLSPEAADVKQIELRIDALQKQIRNERAKLTAGPKAKGKAKDGEALNRAVEEYQRLEMQAQFADEVYRSTVMALERGRVEALRMLKKITVLQQPTLAEEPLEPRRMYNTLVFALLIGALAIIFTLMTAIVRDHQD